MGKRNKRQYYIHKQIKNSLSLENGIACTSVQIFCFPTSYITQRLNMQKNMFLIFYYEWELSVWRLGDS
jgi:hypothetical protein